MELGRSLDFAKVPKREKDEVLAAFAAHKDEVIAGVSGADASGVYSRVNPAELAKGRRSGTGGP